MGITQPAEAHLASASSSEPKGVEVADIFRRFGPSYARTHSVSPVEQRIIDDLVTCRTARLGGHLEWCRQCGFERPAYNSCRNRHCPKCQTLTKLQWVEARRAELLDTDYFHTVLTLPHDLGDLVLGNKRLLLGTLFQAASETLLQFGQRNLGGQLGAIMVLHTWDQLLNAHFHLHALVPGGVLGKDGHTWIPTPAKFLFPVKALSRVFRAKFLEHLTRLYSSDTLRLTGATEALQAPKVFDALVDRLYCQKWVVYAKPPFNGPEQTLSYLGRYTHRVAISNHRLVKIDDGHVHFTYRNRRQGDRPETAQLEVHDFIKRFLLHVVPSGFVRIRHYGLLSNRAKARTLPRCREALGQVGEPSPPEPKTVAQWMKGTCGVDITTCPKCGHQPLERIAIPVQFHPHWNRAPPA